MAYAPSTCEWQCAGCPKRDTYHKIMFSENPEWSGKPDPETYAEHAAQEAGDNRGFPGAGAGGLHAEPAAQESGAGSSDAGGAATETAPMKAKSQLEMKGNRWRVCADCELKWRRACTEEDPALLHKMVGGVKQEPWASFEGVMMDMKAQNKGPRWVSEGMHWKASCEIVERMRTRTPDMSQRSMRRMKHEKTKEMALAFTAIIKSVEGWKLVSAVHATQRLRLRRQRRLRARLRRL